MPSSQRTHHAKQRAARNVSVSEGCTAVTSDRSFQTPRSSSDSVIDSRIIAGAGTMRGTRIQVMTTLLARLLVALILAGLASCTTSRWYPIEYAPAPVEVAVSADAVSGSQARLLASILGVARAHEA